MHDASKIVSSADDPPIENEKSSVNENCSMLPPNNTDVPIEDATIAAKINTAIAINATTDNNLIQNAYY